MIIIKIIINIIILIVVVVVIIIYYYLYLDMLFLGKLKYNIIHLSLHDFSVQNSTLHNYRFISLPSSNR